MKTGFFEVIKEEEISFFKQKLSNHEVVFFDHPLSKDTLPDDKSFDLVSIFVNCQIDSAVLEAFPNLKAIFARSTGFDNVDIDLAKQKNISVFNVPAYGSHTVAEFTFALILNLTRKVCQAVNRVKVERKFSFEDFRGIDLYNKTLGVVGTGKIGTNVIKIARGFEMNVLAFDAYPNQDLAGSLNFKYIPLDELLGLSDIITLHVPYNEQTHHLINSSNINLIKKGALLINTSRGAVIETDALFKALSSGLISGAALDVLEEEDVLKEEIELLVKNTIPEEKYKNILEDHLLLSLPQVIATPHMAFYTKEAEESIRQTTVDNITSFLSGENTNLVNL